MDCDRCAVEKERVADGGPRPRGAARASGWVLPGAVMVLMPKCPMCVAAYFALAGAGISVAAAAWLRWGVLALCVGAMVLRGSTTLMRWVRVWATTGRKTYPRG